MFKILIKTKEFVDKFSQKEIGQYTKNKINIITKELYEIEFNNKQELFDCIMNLTYYSRTIENIYLNLKQLNNIKELDDITQLNLNFIEKDFTFALECHNNLKEALGSIINNSSEYLSVDLDKPNLVFNLLKVNNLNYIALDLIGFKLTKREYKLNINSNTINSLVPNYCFYMLELDKQKQHSIIDPTSSLGDIIVDASMFNPKQAININKRHQIVASRIFNLIPKLPKKTINKNKYIAIVQNNKIFKQLKENINFTQSKIKISQYDLDWLDVKFKESEVDYVISQLPHFKDKKGFVEFQKEFFYMTEFICKKKICVISKKQIEKQIVKNNKLKIEIEKQITIGKQDYYIYIIK